MVEGYASGNEIYGGEWNGMQELTECKGLTLVQYFALTSIFDFSLLAFLMFLPSWVKVLRIEEEDF